MNQEKWTKLWKFIAAIALALSTLATTMSGMTMFAPADEPVARGQVGIGIYTEPGGDKLVVADGGELEVQDGGALDLQDGATVQFDSVVTATNAVIVDGAADVIQFTVQGHSVQTNYLALMEQSDGSDKLAITNEGQVAMDAEADSDAANYDYMFYLHYAMTGVGTKDRNYGIYVDGTRAAGQEVGNGDHDEAGIKVRVDTHAVTTTVGTVLRAIDAEAKADNPDGTVHNLYGGSFTAKSDTSAGFVDTMIALQSNVQNNAQVTTTLISADFRLMRQAAYEPTNEHVVQIRSSSTTGGGCDSGLYFNSDYVGSASTDSFDYGIDLSGAAINTADIRFENGGTLDEGTDTVLTFNEFLAAKEQTACVVTAGSSITPTGTYQPITSEAAVTTSTSIAIVDGTAIGQLLILINENASDAITIDDGGNTHLSGDAVLGNDDTLMLIWDGADWVEIAQANNT